MAAATEDAELAESTELDLVEAITGRIGLVVAGTYRIVRHIGSGGSSHVFQAEHLRLGSPFAIKLLRADLENGRRAAQRFRREARAVARLRGEHVVRVIDCGELDDKTPYLVMELLDGEDLRSLLNRQGPLPACRAVHLIGEACHGLAEVHQSGLVHRDVKPENLFVCRRSTGEDWCKVLDFGVAKMEASIATAHGAIVGTVRYMAPEQLADGASVAAATDVYALGAILYECLSGRPAHAGEAIQEVMFSVMSREPVPLAELCPTLPRSLIDVVERCLAKSPTDRPQQAADLARLLAQHAGVASFRRGPRESTLPDGGQLEPTALPVLPKRSLVMPFGAALLAALAGAWLLERLTTTQAEAAPRASATASEPPYTRSTATAVKAPAVGIEPVAPALRSAEPPTVMSATGKPTLIVPRPQRALPKVDGVGSAAPVSEKAAASGRAVAVGSFDPANPYGE